MLVLARKKGESIVVDGGIQITVLSTEGETVKLGITAPKHVEIHRKEIYDVIQQANQDAVILDKDIQGFSSMVKKYKGK